MCDKIEKQQYHIDLPDDEPFYFNVKEDSEGNVLLQNGSKYKHAHTANEKECFILTARINWSKIIFR